MRETSKDYVSIHKDTGLGPVHYNVVDVDRMVAFYRDIIGMKVLVREPGFVALGTEERELLRLSGGADRPSPWGRATTGLYHTAFLVPRRRDLAHLVRTLIETRTPVQGTSDHGTHLAVYLPDPEGNGIELAWDHPREQWPVVDGNTDLMSQPRRGVDVADLLQSIEGEGEEDWTGLGEGTTVGHVHLHVADLEGAKRFYNGFVGFDVVMHRPSMGASFLSAGGYHHHLGMNIWKGKGLPPAPEGAPGLRYFTVLVPDADELARVAERIGGAVEAGGGPERVGEGAAAPVGKGARDGWYDRPRLWAADPSGNRVLFTTAAPPA